ncbi:MAG: DUF6132 family protein [Verrucomicrobiales bacterium]|nr:DUF6132 family protein [Verrucomicrobiales bacterium]
MTARSIIGAAVGGALGFAAYKLVGCASGACPLTSNPWVSTLIGLALGAMFAGKPERTEPSPNQKKSGNRNERHQSH